MTTVSSLLARARILQDQGCFLAAADLLLARFRADPREAEICQELGNLLIATGDSDEGLDFLRRAHQLAPADPETTVALVLLLEERGLRAESTRCLLESLETTDDPGATVRHLLRLAHPQVTLSAA